MKKKSQLITNIQSSIKKKSILAFLKIILSLLIIYQLIVILILPYKSSTAYQYIKPYLIPYSHTLSMDFLLKNYVIMLNYYTYFEYQVDNSKKTYRWPLSRKESKRLFFNHNRLIYHTRYFMMTNARSVRKHFLPYLCGLHPGSTTIVLKAMVKKEESTQANDMVELFTATSLCKKNKKIRNIDSLSLDRESDI